MAFRFNFFNRNELKEDAEHEKDTVTEHCEKKRKIQDFTAEFREIFPISDTKIDEKIQDMETYPYKISSDLTVNCLSSTALEERLKKEKDESSAIVSATTEGCDLVPNKYEGGLTVWECGTDLGEYISTKVEVKGQSVLELGCGAGIPGLCAYYQGASEVHFQDYNSEVIEEFTIPNVMRLNKQKDTDCKIRFFSGDWSEFVIWMDPDQKYDMILTGETIYNPDNYQKLHDVFTRHLKSDGSIYVAAKSNYYGVGGGTRLFESFIERQGQFLCTVCHTIPADVPREILKLVWKEKEKAKT